MNKQDEDRLKKEIDEHVNDLVDAIMRPCANDKERQIRNGDIESHMYELEQLSAHGELEGVITEEEVKDRIVEALARKKGYDPRGFSEGDVEPWLEEYLGES